MLSDLMRRTPDLRSVADVRLVVTEDGPGRGQRLLLARNATGVALEVAVDRGFDISALSYLGKNIGWHSPVQMAYPSRDPGSEEGWGFLRNFDGFMVTCGLDHYSRPRKVDVSNLNHPHLKSKKMPLHGRITTEKARLLSYMVDTDTLNIRCEAIVRQASVFGEVLELRRKILLPIFASRIIIEDVITNRGYTPSQHAMMYHVNFGYPFLDAGLKISGLPDDLEKELEGDQLEPSDDFGEKVDVADSLLTAQTLPITLDNHKTGVGISLLYDQTVLPKLAVWRALRSGIYALGVEPRTDPSHATTSLLSPGESRTYALELGFSSPATDAEG